jgi:hypothetical protein
MIHMIGKSICDACGSRNLYPIYRLERIPLFQNRLFATAEAARRSPTARVDLTACRDCDLVFNRVFNATLMDYDDSYQNAQEHSPSFRAHLEEMAATICGRLTPGDHIVEIGCGKATFLEYVRARNWRITGYDPAYEGSSPYVFKKYFDAQEASRLKIDAVVMRHALEHMESPYAFLKTLKSIVPGAAKIFIEVPRYEWIERHGAFWDIFHEHCNYFTEEHFQSVFSRKADVVRVFADQYMLVAAHLGDTELALPRAASAAHEDVFSGQLAEYRGVLQDNKRNVVWGGGAKGVAFVNILDPDAHGIEAVIDINPRKQGQFIAATGHPCVAPEAVDLSLLDERDCLWIMNANYADEILASLPALRCRIETLGKA